MRPCRDFLQPMSVTGYGVIDGTPNAHGAAATRWRPATTPRRRDIWGVGHIYILVIILRKFTSIKIIFPKNTNFKYYLKFVVNVVSVVSVVSVVTE